MQYKSDGTNVRQACSGGEIRCDGDWVRGAGPDCLGRGGTVGRGPALAGQNVLAALPAGQEVVPAAVPAGQEVVPAARPASRSVARSDLKPRQPAAPPRTL